MSHLALKATRTFLSRDKFWNSSYVVRHFCSRRVSIGTQLPQTHHSGRSSSPADGLSKKQFNKEFLCHCGWQTAHKRLQGKIAMNNFNEIECFCSCFNRLNNLPWFPPLTAECLLCDSWMHYRVLSVHSPVRWPHFCHSYIGVSVHIRNVKSTSCRHFCTDSLHFTPSSFCYILFCTSKSVDKEPINIFW